MTIAWDRIQKHSVKLPRRKWSRKSIRRKQHANAVAHYEDHNRQEIEQTLNWDRVKEFLDKGLSLEAAKRKAKRIK